MGRKPCCEKEGLNRGAWSAIEDKILADYVNKHGQGKWRDLPQRAGLKRCGKSCRLRWLNYLRPGIMRGNFSTEEEDLIVRLHKLLGNRWALIAGRLPGRTDNEIKNYWNTNLSKRVLDNINVKVQGSSESKELMKPATERSLTAQHSNGHVIRTKAVRCSKVVIPNWLLRNEDKNMIGQNSVPFKEIISDQSKSIGTTTDNVNISDFLMDFDMEKILTSEIILDHVDNHRANKDHTGKITSNSVDQIARCNFDNIHDHYLLVSDPFGQVADHNHGLDDLNEILCFLNSGGGDGQLNIST